MNILCYIVTFLYIFIILFISELLKNKKIVSEETARKVVHILVSFAYIIMYKMIYTNINIVIIPAIFIFINFISYKKNIFKGMEITSRNSMGTVFYPMSMMIMALITYFHNDFYPFYGIGLFIMAFADGLAPIVADKFQSKKIFNANRSINGSMTVFIISIIVIFIFNMIFNLDISLIKIVLLGFISMFLEGVSGKYDNLILPIGISIASFLI